MTANLPSTIGPVEFDRDKVRLWCADARKFDPKVAATDGSGIAPEDATKHNPNLQLPAPGPLALLPSTSFIPREYQVHIHSQLCANCGTSSEWSCIYAYNSAAPRMGLGRGVSNWVAVAYFSYNIPVRAIRIPPTKVPTCHECVPNLDLSHLPKPQDTEEYKRITAAYQEAKPPKAARPGGQEPAKEPKAPTKKYTTMDDFL